MNQEDGAPVELGYVGDIEDLVNLAVRVRALIYKEGFTQLRFRNPETGEERTYAFLLTT
jgi:hypothetical protein